MTYIQSPLNYTGGKYKLLPQILPLFPQEIDTFVDLFCGGGNVGINAKCQSVWFNDLDSHVIGMLETFANGSISNILDVIYETIETYELSLVSKFGYEHYNCDSGVGLSSYNRVPYMNLRTIFNRLSSTDSDYYLILYVLVVYAFNNQIRFNKKGEFNLPVGKRDFNSAMQDKLVAFVDKLHNINCQFTSFDFRTFDISLLGQKDFVYVDPPYLITCASYNENGGWNETIEHQLLEFLDKLNDNHIKFALSNVLTNKGKTNLILSEWIHKQQKHYTCYHLNNSYRNSNYHILDRKSVSDEILITNY